MSFNRQTEIHPGSASTRLRLRCIRVRVCVLCSRYICSQQRTRHGNQRLVPQQEVVLVFNCEFKCRNGWCLYETHGDTEVSFLVHTEALQSWVADTRRTDSYNRTDVDRQADTHTTVLQQTYCSSSEEEKLCTCDIQTEVKNKDDDDTGKDFSRWTDDCRSVVNLLYNHHV